MSVDNRTIERRYETVLNEIGKGKDRILAETLLNLLSGKSLSERIAYFQDKFRAARHDRCDETALRYWWLLSHAIKDEELLPVLTKDGVVSWEDEGLKALGRVNSKVAFEATELFALLPEEWPDKCNGHFAFPKTKIALFSKVAEQWGNTKDKSESDKLFFFLRNVNIPHEEEKPYFDLVRKATDFHFPVPRLTRHLLQELNNVATSTSGLGKDGYLFDILAIARARNSDSERMLRELKILNVLEGRSSDAHWSVQEFAQKVADIDQKADELRKTILTSRSKSTIWSENEVQVTVSPSSRIRVSVYGKYWTAEAVLWQKKHDESESVRNVVRAWQKKHGIATVDLDVRATSKDEPKPFFIKRESISMRQVEYIL